MPSKSYTLEELKIDDLFLQGCTEAELGNYTKALSLLDDVIKLDPKYSAAYYKKANVFLVTMQLDNSIENYKKAVELSPNNIWYNHKLAKLYSALSRWKESAELFEKIIELDPNNVERYQELVEIYYAGKNEKAMLKTLDAMEKKWGVNEDVSMFKFKYHNERENHKAAEKEIEKLIDNFPNDIKYLAIMAEMKMSKKEYSKAIKYYDKIAEIAPDDPHINVSLTNYYLIQKDEENTYKYLQKAFANKDLDYNTKIQILFTIYGATVDNDDMVFGKFFELLKVLSEQYPDQGVLWELMATGYMKTENFGDAVISLKKAISLGSKDYEVYQNLLFAQSTLNLPDSMIVDSKKAIELFPEQPLPYLFLGVNYMYKEDHESANKTLLRGERLVVNNKALLEDFYSNIAETYYRLEDFENSNKYFDKTLDINPLNYVVLNNYAYYLSLREAQLEKAEKMAKKVYDKYPKYPTYVDTYAWVLFKMKKYNRAKEVMDSILDQKENWGETLNEHYEEIIRKAD